MAQKSDQGTEPVVQRALIGRTSKEVRGAQAPKLAAGFVISKSSIAGQIRSRLILLQTCMATVPNETGKKTFYKKWWVWVLAVLFLMVLVSGALDGEDEATGNLNAPQTDSIVDGPHLLSITIDQARVELGPPNEDEFVEPTEDQLKLGAKSWTNEFTVDGYTIILDFDVASREVTEFFISPVGTSEENLVRDWEALMRLGGLSKDSDDYTVEPIEALKYPGRYTGVVASE